MQSGVQTHVSEWRKNTQQTQNDKTTHFLSVNDIFIDLHHTFPFQQ